MFDLTAKLKKEVEDTNRAKGTVPHDLAGRVLEHMQSLHNALSHVVHQEKDAFNAVYQKANEECAQIADKVKSAVKPKAKKKAS